MKQLFTLFSILAIGISAWGQVTDPTFSPLDNATGVSVSPTLSMTFDGYTEAIIAESNTNIYIWNIGNSSPKVTLPTGDGFLPQDSRITMSGNTITLDLTSSTLDYNTNYAVVIYDNTIDVDGTYYNELQNVTKWSFTTEAAPTPPSITTLTPVDEATDVPVDQTLQVTFNENIVSGSSGYFTIYEDGVANIAYPYNSGNVNIATNTLTVTHTAFKNATNYYITIDADFVRSQSTDASFGGISNATTWNFTTVVADPQWNSGFPNITPPTKTNVVVNGQVDKDGNYYMVVTQSAGAPLAAQIKLGNDENDATALLPTTGTVTANEAFSPSLDITSLSSETPYWVYAVCEDASGNYSTVVQMPFTTQDTQAPTYLATYPNVSDITGTGATLNVAIDDDGEFFWVVLPQGDAAPTAAQVKDGQDASGGPATFNGYAVLTANTAAQATATGLAYGTAYTAYFVSTDDNNNDLETGAATERDFSTLAAPPSIASYLPTENATDVPVNQSLQLTFNENIRFVSGSLAKVNIMYSSDDTEFESYGVTSGYVTITDATLTINPVGLFAENTQYYVTMDDGFVESSSTFVDFGGISSTTQWTFTTEVLGPQWNSGFPNITPPTKTDVVVNGQVDKSGNYYMVLTQSPSAPSAAQIKLGNDEYDATALLPTTGAVTAGVTFNPSLDISSLSSETTYWVYVVTESTPDTFSSVRQLTFTTQDTQAPVYNFVPGVFAFDANSVAFDVEINENGLFYWVILPTGETAPSPSQVKLGQDAGGTAATIAGGGPIDGALTANITSSSFTGGLTESTDYVAYIVSSDNNGNDIETSSATAIPFSTPGPPPTVTSYVPLQDAIDVPIGQSLQLTFDENIQFVTGTTAAVTIRRTSDNGLFGTYEISSDNVSITDNILTIANVKSFVENRSYYVTIGDRFVESVATGGAFEGISGTTAWTFTTEILPAQWALGFPTIGIPTKTSVVVNGQVSKSGTYYMVLTQSATAPSAAQIKLGNDENDATALIATSDVSTADTQFNPALDISGLETQTQYWVYVVAETTVDKFSTVEQLTFTTVQTSWADTYPHIQNQTKTSMDVLGQVDAAGVYHLVVTTSATVPTEAQIIAGQDDTGNPALLPTTGGVVADEDFVVNLDLTTLVSETDYWVHIVVVDEFGKYTAIKTIAFTQQDTEVPAYTPPRPNATVLSGTGVTLEVEINESGIAHYVVLLATDPAPSIAQVMDGTNASDVPVSNSGSKVLVANAETQITKNIYTSETSYKAYFVTHDNNYNYIETTSPTEVSFTTLDVTDPVATFDPVDMEVDVLLDKTITITLSEEVYNAAEELITNDNVGTIVNLREDSPAGTIVPSSITYDPLTYIITIDPNSNLQELQLYNIKLLELRDASNNILPLQNSMFTTQDITPPVTEFLSPGAGEEDFPINVPLTIGFDEAIQNIDGSAITDLDLQTLISFTPSFSFTASINAEANMITITPDANIAGSTIYTITVGIVEDIYGNEQTTDASTSFTTDSYKVWNGSVSSDFNISDNWTGIGTETSIIIPQSPTNQPIISSSLISLKNVTIEAGASLTIAESITTTITKSLELRSSLDPNIGNANLLVKGSLITTNATVSIQQEIGGENPGVRESVYISSPVVGATQDNTGIATLYRRNASASTWETLTSSEVMESGIGYIGYGNTGDIINFSGTINNSGVGPIATVRTTTPNNFGWNLIGNPFPCSIDWEGISTFNMRDGFYILNDETEVYGTYNGNDGDDATYVNLNTDNPSHIPSCHSFWTQVSIGETTGDITIPTTARANTHYSYLKNTKVITSQQIRFAGINSENVKDEILISFDANASDEFDSYDTEKRFSANQKVMQFYAMQSSQKLAISTYNNYEAGRAIELGYRVGQAGDYKLALIELLNAEENAIIKIEDKLNGTLQTMALNDEYAFTTQAGTFENRFVVHIAPAISTNVNQIEDNYPISIFSSGSYIYIKTPELTKPYYQLYNTSGRLVQSGLLQAQDENKIYSEYEGLLLIKIISNEKIVGQKVFVKK